MIDFPSCHPLSPLMAFPYWASIIAVDTNKRRSLAAPPDDIVVYLSQNEEDYPCSTTVKNEMTFHRMLLLKATKLALLNGLGTMCIWGAFHAHRCSFQQPQNFPFFPSAAVL